MLSDKHLIMTDMFLFIKSFQKNSKCVIDLYI